MKRIVKQGFTLIELLTVLAITAVLLTIIVVPVFQSFNFTRSAQAFSDAQDRARVVADRISRAIGNAVSVRSTTNLVQTYLNGNLTSVPAHSLIVQVPKRGNGNTYPPVMIDVVLPYVKMDLITAAEGDVPGTPGVFTNPVTGFTDPTMNSPKGQPVLPAGPGATIIRYFVGLRDPLSPAGYNNPYDGILMGFNGNRDNLFVLYKAEVTPFVYRAGVGTNGDTTLKYRPNLAYFQSDFATDTQIADLDDPRFFLNDLASSVGNTNISKTQRIENWQAKAVLQTELSRYDMIQPIYDKASHAVTYIGDAPQIVPLIQFRPSHQSNDPARGQVAVRLGEESDNSATIGPDVYTTKYGLWSNQTVRVWPQNYSPIPGTIGFSQYLVGRNDPSNGQAGAPPGYSVYYYDPAISVTDYNSGTELFDITTYDTVAAAQGLYPFSQGLNAANNRSNWMTNQVMKDRFTPFDMNTPKGKVLFGFDISSVGNPNTMPQAANPQNLPTVLTSPVGYGPYSPTQDPSYVPPVSSPTFAAGYIPGNFYDPAFQTINELYNWVYINAPNLSTQVDRFIDLRVTPQADGTPSPLHPTLGFAKCTITPGSEIVYGPDQLPGPNFGNTVRYVRTTRAPGPNQYQINYVDQPEPRDPPTAGTDIAGPIDYSLIGLTQAQLNGFNPTAYDPQNFCSAVIQPRFKKGYIRFNSDPNSPLPLGQIQVAYRFQFNGSETSVADPNNPGSTMPVPAGVQASDVVAVDYDTRQLMSVLLTIRNYPQTTNIPNPQTVTVKATATVRNVIR